MSTVSRERVKTIFFAAVDLPEDQRLGFVDEACGGDNALCAEVRSLLAHDSGDADAFAEARIGILREALADVVGPRSTIERAGHAEAAIPQCVGRYKIIRPIGQGGMGVVYEARQENPDRTVAIKVIRPGLGTERILRRFEHEAEVLGRLQHRGIAHIYEAGVGDVQFAGGVVARQPFFAMEFIRGRPLLEFVRSERLGTRQRLELFAHICDAAQHAHDAGVIHRDIKPANILVDAAGQPKVLDFGVARLTDADVQVTTLHTDVGQLIGTLPYMSPEQVVGDSRSLDARSDVYALGVVLYEMLSGTLPYDLRTCSVPEAIHLIRTAEPSRISTRESAFRGDVETIVAKALEKDPQRRYASAEELAVDLRRHLAHQPIGARPASTFYQFRKFAHRHKAAVIGAIVVFTVLVAGVITTSVGMVRAQSAEALARVRLTEAQAARSEAEAVTEFLRNMLASADPAKTEGRAISIRELLDTAALRIDEFGDGTPAVNSAIHQTIGRTYQQIGQYREATPHFQAALELRTTAFGRSDLRTQRSIYDLCDNLFVCDQLDEAAPLLAQSIASLRTGDPNNRELLGRQLYTLGRIHKQRAQYADAIACLRESADLLRNRGEGAPGLALALNELGNVLSRESHHAEAEAAFDEAIAVQREAYGPRSAHVGGLLGNLAVAVKRQGRIEDAERLYREALDIQRSTHGLEHPSTLGTMVNLGSMLADCGAHEDAESMLREALPVLRRLHGSESYHIGIACGKLAEALRKQGELSEARTFADESLAIFRAAMGQHPYTAMSLTVLGNVQYDLSEFASAAESFSEALAIYRKTLGEKHAAVADTQALHEKARQAVDDEGQE